MAAYNPFRVAENLEKCSYVFYLYWILPLVISSIRVAFIIPDNTICLYISTDIWSAEIIAIIVILLLIDIIVFITTIILSERSVYYMKQSAEQAGREWSRGDQAIMNRCVLLNLTNGCMLIVMYLPTIFQFISYDNSADLHIWLNTLLLPLCTIVDPIVTTFSTTAFRPSFCVHGQ